MLLQQAIKAKTVLHDESKSWQSRIFEARQLLAELGESATGSFVSQVRKALAEDAQRVHACLAALKDLEFGGREGNAGYEQWRAWTDCKAKAPSNCQRPLRCRSSAPRGTVWFTTWTRALPGVNYLELPASIILSGAVGA